jgi:transposase
MLRPDFAKWNQTPEDMLDLAREADHPRSQERYMALYAIGTKQSNATAWAKATGRENETVMGWVHTYNEGGPAALPYQPSGACSPLLPKTSERNL